MDYLEKRYQQDIEAQKEREKERLEEIKKDPAKYMSMSGIRKRYVEADITKIKLPQRIIKVAKDFVEGKHQGLFLTGAVGSGKTYLACAVARELLFKNEKVSFYSAPELFQNIRATFNKVGGSEEGIIRKLSDCDCLLLDDLGAEKTTDFTIDRLYLIIDYRYGEMKKTIITSNLDLQEIKEKIHDRLASRIFEMCKRVVMPSKDLRVEE